MPSTNTITAGAFNVFVPRQLIASSDINENFGLFRGHLSPVDPNTITSADSTYDLGAVDNRWKNMYGNVAVLTQQSTPAANPTTGQYKVYMKSDGIMYRLNSSGVEAAVTTGVPLTTKGDIAVHDGSATIRFPIGSNGNVLTADSSATAGLKWAAPGALSISTKTTTYSATTSDDILLADASSAAFSIWLPTVTSGKPIEIQKIDSTFNLVTINSSANIEGASTTTLGVQYEGARFVPDGTTWRVIGRRDVTKWTAYTPTFTGFGTPSSVDFYWRKVGGNLEVRGRFIPGTCTATEARMSLPSGLTSGANIQTLAVAGQLLNNVIASTLFSFAVLMEASVAYVTFGRRITTSTDYAKVNASTGFASGDLVTMSFSIPITGWNA